jgi:hypothetical protein
MTNLILRNTRLNKNLSSIVFKYVDYSLKNLSSMVDSKKYKPHILELPILDLMIRSIKHGYVGFYMNHNSQNQLKIWMDNFSEKNKNLIDIIEGIGQLTFILKSHNKKGYNLCSLYLLINIKD